MSQKPKTDVEVVEMSRVPYQSLIGFLMYLAFSTRPDIAYAVSSLSQFNQNPGKAYWLSAKRVLRYLKGTRNCGLNFRRKGDELFGYVDADWGAGLDDRRSYTGYVFKLTL
ncbi:secreted RxLR effector protein 161-like [Belonocnema kinseyi]|uniref:secreted RxLR effector protein 161-like n=1 Tax=Belonocnema kinseyi TaxID=2817044 RepID=UPI00143CE5CD|nr:secreted RxLR effector protein 161-like [Belonocnema kinseyi]